MKNSLGCRVGEISKMYVQFRVTYSVIGYGD